MPLSLLFVSLFMTFVAPAHAQTDAFACRNEWISTDSVTNNMYAWLDWDTSRGERGAPQAQAADYVRKLLMEELGFTEKLYNSCRPSVIEYQASNPQRETCRLNCIRKAPSLSERRDLLITDEVRKRFDLPTTVAFLSQLPRPKQEEIRQELRLNRILEGEADQDSEDQRAARDKCEKSCQGPEVNWVKTFDRVYKETQEHYAGYWETYNLWSEERVAGVRAYCANPKQKEACSGTMTQTSYSRNEVTGQRQKSSRTVPCSRTLEYYMLTDFGAYGELACCQGTTAKYKLRLHREGYWYNRAKSWVDFCNKTQSPPLQEYQAPTPWSKNATDKQIAEYLKKNPTITATVTIRMDDQPVEEIKTTEAKIPQQDIEKKETEEPKKSEPKPTPGSPIPGQGQPNPAPSDQPAPSNPSKNDRVPPVFGNNSSTSSGNGSGTGIECTSNSNKGCTPLKTNPVTTPTPPEWKKPTVADENSVSLTDMNVSVGNCNPNDGAGCTGGGTGGGGIFKTENSTQCTATDNRNFDKIDRRFLACAFCSPTFADMAGSSMASRDTNVGESFAVWMNLAQACVYRFLMPDGISAPARTGMCSQVQPTASVPAARVEEIQRITSDITLRCTEHLGNGPQ